jgi:flagellar biosynthesis protein FliQ
VIATAALVAVRNATVYPAVLGYDAQEALDYAEGLVEHGRLPEGTGSYYTPPGFFAVAGVGLEVSDRLGLDHRERTAQVFNALAAAGTLVLLLVLLRLLWPGRDVLYLAAVVFCAVCPVVLKAAAMVHPEPLSMLLSTGALVLAARLLVRSDHRLLTAVALGACLGLAQLVRAWTLWTLGVVVAVLVVAAATRVGERRRLGVATAVTVVVALLVPAPWYAHQVARYDSAIFDRPAPEQPLWSRRPLAFFVGSGLPAVVTDPYRPSFANRFVPVAYAETWGDYYGVWRWFPSGGAPTSSVRRELTTMSLVGLPFTVTALAGWLALLGLALRHPGTRPERHLVALLPLGALAGALYFATAYPTPDGDTVKGSFMLTAVPAWAACFGFAFDELRARYVRLRPLLVGALVLLAAVAAPFLLARSRL